MKESTAWSQESVQYSKAVLPALTTVPPLSLYPTAETLLSIKSLNKTLKFKSEFMVPPERQDNVEFHDKSSSRFLNCEHDRIRTNHNQMVKNCSVVLNRLPAKILLNNVIGQRELLDNLSVPEKQYLSSSMDVRNSNDIATLHSKSFEYTMENPTTNSWDNVDSNYNKSSLIMSSLKINSMHSKISSENIFFSPPSMQSSIKGLEAELSNLDTVSADCNIRSDDSVRIGVANHFKEQRNFFSCAQSSVEHDQCRVKSGTNEPELYSKDYFNPSPSQRTSESLSNVISSVQTSVIRVPGRRSSMSDILDTPSSCKNFSSGKHPDLEQEMNSLARPQKVDSQKESQESKDQSSNFIKPCKIRLSLSSENGCQKEGKYYTVECSDAFDRNGWTRSNLNFENSNESSLELNNNEEGEKILFEASPSVNKSKKVSSLSVYVQTEGSKLINITCKRFRKRKRQPVPLKYISDKQISGQKSFNNPSLDKEWSTPTDDIVREMVRYLVDKTLLSSFPSDELTLDIENANTKDLVQKFCVDHDLNFNEFEDLKELFSTAVINDDNGSVSQRTKYKRKSRFSLDGTSKKKRKDENITDCSSNMDYRELRKLPGRVKNRHLRGTVVKNFYLRSRTKNGNAFTDYQMSTDSEEYQTPLKNSEECNFDLPSVRESPERVSSRVPELENENALRQEPGANCDSSDDDCLLVIDDDPMEKPELRRASDNGDYGNSTDIDTPPELVPVIVSSRSFTDKRSNNNSDVPDSDDPDRSNWSFRPIRQKSESPKDEMPKKNGNEGVSEFRNSSESFHPPTEDTEKQPDESCINNMAAVKSEQKTLDKVEEDDDDTINITDDSMDGMNFCESLLENTYSHSFDSESERREREREKSILRMLLLDSSGNEIPSEEAENNGFPIISKVMSLREASEVLDPGSDRELFSKKLLLKREVSSDVAQSRHDNSLKPSKPYLEVSQHDSKNINKSKDLLSNSHAPSLLEAGKLSSNRFTSGDQHYPQPNVKDFHETRRISLDRNEESRENSKVEDWMSDCALLKEKIKRLRNEIVYLKLIANQKEKEKVAILCFKRYKEEMLKRVYRQYYSNKSESERSNMTNELTTSRRPKESFVNGQSKGENIKERVPQPGHPLNPGHPESFVHHRHPYYPLPQRKTHSSSPFPCELRESPIALDSQVMNDHCRHGLSSASARENERDDHSKTHLSRGQILHQMLTSTTAASTESSRTPPVSTHHQPVSSPNPWCDPSLKLRIAQSENSSFPPKSVCQPSPLIPSVITRTHPHMTNPAANFRERQELFRNPVMATYPPFPVSSPSEPCAPKLVPRTTSARTLQMHPGTTVVHSPVPRPPLAVYYGPPTGQTHIRSSMGADTRLFPQPKPALSAVGHPRVAHNLDHYRATTMNKQYPVETRTVNASPVQRRSEVPSADFSPQEFRPDANQSNSNKQVPSCMSCGLLNAKFLCSGCRKHWYCSPQCQSLLWPHHSKVCPGRDHIADRYV